jgi:hypothetical protein
LKKAWGERQSLSLGGENSATIQTAFEPIKKFVEMASHVLDHLNLL